MITKGEVCELLGTGGSRYQIVGIRIWPSPTWLVVGFPQSSSRFTC